MLPGQRYIRNNPPPWTEVGTRLAQIDSTNAEVQRRLRAALVAGVPLAEGTSVRADFQTAGRGRHGRHWEGAPGANLSVSYALGAAGLPPDRLFALSQNLALAVRELVEDLTGEGDVHVKWPNDVYAAGRKVAGLLLESTLQRGDVACVIAGVGVNVNQTDFGQAAGATSLALLAGRTFDVDRTWERLTLSLQAAHAVLARHVQRGDLYPLQRDYHGHLLGLGESSRFERLSDGSTFAARLLGVAPDGRLRLERSGREEVYTLDEVRWRGVLSVAPRSE